MSCNRCTGLMVLDSFCDMDDSARLWVEGWRCVACGNVAWPEHTPLLLKNPRRGKKPARVLFKCVA